MKYIKKFEGYRSMEEGEIELRRDMKKYNL